MMKRKFALILSVLLLVCSAASAQEYVSVAELYEQAQAMGLTILEGGLQSLPFWERGIKYFIILGPNNEKIEFCERL